MLLDELGTSFVTRWRNVDKKAKMEMLQAALKDGDPALISDETMKSLKHEDWQAMVALRGHMMKLRHELIEELMQIV